MFIPKSLQLNPAEGILEGCSYGEVVIENVVAFLMRHHGRGAHTGRSLGTRVPPPTSSLN